MIASEISQLSLKLEQERDIEIDREVGTTRCANSVFFFFAGVFFLSRGIWPIIGIKAVRLPSRTTYYS